MIKKDIIEFLKRIDEHLARNHAELLGGTKFQLNLIGKSALILGGLEDSTGTVDIDSLCVDSRELPEADRHIIDVLEKVFGKAHFRENDYYLEFVTEAIVFLPQKPTWVPFESSYSSLSARYLESHYVIASKLFSAFAAPPRKQDKEDVVRLLDQKLVELRKVAAIADEIFGLHSMDARSSRFPKVHEYLTEELMDTYGEVPLRYDPEDAH